MTAHKEKLFKKNFFIFTCVVLIMFALMLVWISYKQFNAFKVYHQNIAEKATHDVANSIEHFIKERQRLVKLFTQVYMQQIQQLAHSPDDQDLYDAINLLVKKFFPQAVSFTLADKSGLPLIEDFDGYISKMCLTDLKDFSRVNRYQPYIHPNAYRYHFDILQNVKIDNERYIFFVSFDADSLATFLNSAEVNGHKVMLIYKEADLLLEVTASGARNRTPRNDYHLNEREISLFLYEKPIEDTRWHVVDSYIDGLFQNYRNNLIQDAAFIYILVAVFGIYMLFQLYQDHYKLVASETLLRQHKQNLETKVKQKTQEALQELDLRTKQENYLLEEEQVASLGRMVSGVAHEISTPIGNGLMGNSQIAYLIEELENQYHDQQMSEDDFTEFLESSKKLTRSVEIALKNATHMVKSFKTIAAEQSHEVLHAFALKQYIDDVLLSMHNQLKKTQIKLEINCDANLYINSYPGIYSQIFNNLINNSLLHGFKKDQEGTISIDITKSANRLNIVYRDTGNGISKEHLEHIFEPFYTTKRGAGGTGQGMYIILKLIHDRLNGSINCSSEKGQGVRFDIDVQADFEQISQADLDGNE